MHRDLVLATCDNIVSAITQVEAKDDEHAEFDQNMSYREALHYLTAADGAYASALSAALASHMVPSLCEEGGAEPITLLKGVHSLVTHVAVAHIDEDLPPCTVSTDVTIALMRGMCKDAARRLVTFPEDACAMLDAAFDLVSAGVPAARKHKKSSRPWRAAFV